MYSEIFCLTTLHLGRDPHPFNFTQHMGRETDAQRNTIDCGVNVMVFLYLILSGQRDKIKDYPTDFLTTFDVREQILIFVLRGAISDGPPLR